MIDPNQNAAPHPVEAQPSEPTMRQALGELAVGLYFAGQSGALITTGVIVAVSAVESRIRGVDAPPLAGVEAIGLIAAGAASAPAAFSFGAKAVKTAFHAGTAARHNGNTATN